MKKVFSFFLLVILLSGCDNDMKLISRDFSVSLKNMDSNTATVGKVVKCVFTVDGLDKDNDDLLYTSFDVEGGSGIIIIENNEYSPGETFTVDYKQSNRLSFDFIPAVEGTQSFIMTVTSDVATRSDNFKIKVDSPEIALKFSNLPSTATQYQETDFYLSLSTNMYDVKGTARFVKGSGKLYINGYDAMRGEGIKLVEDNNLIAFTPDSKGEVIIEFSVSSKYGTPKTQQITINVI